MLALRLVLPSDAPPLVHRTISVFSVLAHSIQLHTCVLSKVKGRGCKRPDGAPHGRVPGSTRRLRTHRRPTPAAGECRSKARNKDCRGGANECDRPDSQSHGTAGSVDRADYRYPQFRPRPPRPDTVTRCRTDGAHASGVCRSRGYVRLPCAGAEPGCRPPSSCLRLEVLTRKSERSQLLRFCSAPDHGNRLRADVSLPQKRHRERRGANLWSPST